jgi:hypothetical protein
MTLINNTELLTTIKYIKRFKMRLRINICGPFGNQLKTNQPLRVAHYAYILEEQCELLSSEEKQVV